MRQPGVANGLAAELSSRRCLARRAWPPAAVGYRLRQRGRRAIPRSSRRAERIRNGIVRRFTLASRSGKRHRWTHEDRPRSGAGRPRHGSGRSSVAHARHAADAATAARLGRRSLEPAPDVPCSRSGLRRAFSSAHRRQPVRGLPGRGPRLDTPLLVALTIAVGPPVDAGCCCRSAGSQPGTSASVDGSTEHRDPTLVDLCRGSARRWPAGVVIPVRRRRLLVAFLALRRWRLAAFTLFVICIESGAYRATTLVVHRDRPHVDRLESLPVDASYPSGHTAAARCAATAGCCSCSPRGSRSHRRHRRGLRVPGRDPRCSSIWARHVPRHAPSRPTSRPACSWVRARSWSPCSPHAPPAPLRIGGTVVDPSTRIDERA